MEVTNLLSFSERKQLREWFEQNHLSEKCCWVACNRSKAPKPETLPYIEIVEEALCFGWIDSTLKKLPDGRLAQRLSPRRKGSHWTELNRQRCQDPERRGLMTDAGRKALHSFFFSSFALSRITSDHRVVGDGLRKSCLMALAKTSAFPLPSLRVYC